MADSANTITTTSHALTMSSREIAELTGKAHRNVIRDIEKMLNDVGEGLLKFEHTYQNEQNGQKYREFLLPKNLTLTLVTGYRTDMRFKIINRWMELENITPRLPTNVAAAHKQAGAIFRSLNHVGKLTGMSREDAARAASAAARKHTGIDVLGELHSGLLASAAKNDALVAVMAARPGKALTEDDIAEGISCAIRVLSQLRTGSAQANIAEREQDLKMAGHAVMQMWDDVQRLKQEQQGRIR